MPPSKPHMAENRLIAALSRKDRQHLLAGCEEVELTSADVLCSVGDRVRQVYFPTTSYISLLTPLDGNGGLEVGQIGNEGVFGISLVLGVDSASLRAIVQGSGLAWKMNGAPFRRELADSPGLLRTLKRYIYVLRIQLAQSVACTRFHVVEERLARWLLMTQDRAHSDEFHVTQETLGGILRKPWVAYWGCVGAVSPGRQGRYRTRK